MIRFRITAVSLITVLLTAALSGCTYGIPAEPAGEDAASGTAASVNEVSESSRITTGGSPWIDSEIKANLTEDMELSVKDDFYLAANYDWLMSTDIPEGKPRYNAFSEVEDRIEDNIAKFMNDKAAAVQSHEAGLSQTFYHALLDWEARDKTGFEPAREKIAAIMDIKDTDELTSFLCDTGKSCFVPSGIDVYNGTYFADSTRYIVMIDDIHDSLLLMDPTEYKERSDMGEVYYQAAKELTENMLTRAGFSEEEADAVLEGAIEFETQLAEDVPTSVELNSPEHFHSITNLYDMDGLKKLYKAYPIEELLHAKGYGGAEQYQVTTPDYAAKLGSLYKDENLEQIKDYMLVNYCILSANKLDREAFEAFYRYNNALYGASGKMSETYYAINLTRRYLPDAITKAYVEYYHLEETKNKIKKLCEDIINVYEHMLGEEDWLSAEMKERAIEKLHCMEIHSLYPEKYTDYDSLEFTGDSAYGYFEQAEIFNSRHDASYTGQAVDRGEWNFMHDHANPLMANAAYSPEMNSIYIFAGIIADPIYREDMSDEECYGCLGQVIGHEISHAFDPIGSQYDKDGNLKNWWTAEDQQAFHERAEKLIKYYDTITIWDGLNASGELDQSEIVADMGAMKAILTLVKDKTDFDYETFFRSFAGLWRCVSSPEIEYISATQDPHPVLYLRINVVVQQFEEFYKTFGIKEGDRMYLAPGDRVAVW